MNISEFMIPLIIFYEIKARIYFFFFFRLLISSRMEIALI